MTEPHTPHGPEHDPGRPDPTDAYASADPGSPPPHHAEDSPAGDPAEGAPGAPPWAPGQGGHWAPPHGQHWGSWAPPPPGAYGQGYGGSGYGGPSYGGGGYGYEGGGYPGYGHWGPPPPQRARHTTILAIVAVAALVLLAAAVGGIAGHDLRSGNASSNRLQNPYSYNNTLPGGDGGTSGGAGGSSNGAGGPSDVNAIAAKVSPDLVDINVTFSYQQAQGAGTGVVLTPDGEILTNNHVIDGATTISVTDVGNGQTYKASVVGYDPTHDLAVLQAKDASKLKTATIGTSSKLQVGQAVVGIGNAGGSGGTPSSAGGSITALNQSITAGDELDGTNEQLTGLIQTNANIQSGDSGGSLVNSAGQVIGIDTAASQGFSFGGQSQGGGQGYAIPIDQAMATTKQIEAGKSSATVHVGPTAFLGVLVSAGNSNGQGGFGGSQGGFGGSQGNQGGGSTSGATVSGVVPNGAAANAGLAQGDVITSFDGQSINSPTSLSHLLLPHHPGDKVSMTWTDTSGQSHTATVTLGSGPAS